MPYHKLCCKLFIGVDSRQRHFQNIAERVVSLKSNLFHVQHRWVDTIGCQAIGLLLSECLDSSVVRFQNLLTKQNIGNSNKKLKIYTESM